MPSIKDQQEKAERMLKRAQKLPKATKPLPNLCIIVQGVPTQNASEGEMKGMYWGWKVELVHNDRRMTTDFHQGSGHENPPTVQDILYSLVSDAQCAHGNTFEDFCGELGYDSDSRKAEKLFHACRDTGAKLIRLFGDEQYLKLLAMDEDAISNYCAEAPTFKAW